jgi:probable HAF family extracellular repeat protein
MTHLKVALLSVAVIGSLAAATGTYAAAPAASFQWLGKLEGAAASQALGISADGTTVVGWSGDANGPGRPHQYEAFRWTAATGIVGLGYAAGAESSWAYGASADGSVVVGMSRTDWHYEAYRWTQGTGIVPLGRNTGSSDNTAYGVSADGNAIVGTSRTAFRWTPQDGMTDLGEYSGGYPYSEAMGVSADGSIVVGYGNSGPFRWTEATGQVGLLSDGWHNCEAWAVSADGRTAVGRGVGPNPVLEQESWRWTPETGMVSLGDAFWSEGGCGPYDVSADGSVIVGQAEFGGFYAAFIWTPEKGCRELKEVLEHDHGLDTTGFDFYRATGVSDDGRTITGFGFSTNEEAWIVTLPEPATLSLLALGGLAMLRRRRRNR